MNKSIYFSGLIKELDIDHSNTLETSSAEEYLRNALSVRLQNRIDELEEEVKVQDPGLREWMEAKSTKFRMGGCGGRAAQHIMYMNKFMNEELIRADKVRARIDECKQFKRSLK